MSNPVTERVDRSVSAELQSAIAGRLESWTDARVAGRLWQKDGTLWSASGKPPDELAAWLGWLDLPESMQARLPELEQLAAAVRRDGYTRAAVLGMGGSSLAPEVFSRVFGFGDGAAAPGSDGLELRILDSTHPAAVRGFREWATAARTIFCVSSKSGTTTEPNAFHAVMAAEAPALDFIAITDPGTALADLARSQEFRAIVDGPPDVGGRYSALTVFGLLPAALHGVPITALLARASAMGERCRQAPDDNPGLRLGAYLGEAAAAGRDKLTILTSSRLASFGDWVEQLIAESTGKRGTGIVPIVGEPIGEPRQYGDDRCFVLITLADDPDTEWGRLSESLTGLGHPFLHIELADALDIGGEFIRWEVATAAAGMILEIDPFDQPNVQESKDATRQLLASARDTGRLTSAAPLVATQGMALYGDPVAIGDTPPSVDGGIRQLLSLVQPGDYVAMLAYLPKDREVEALLQRTRAQIRDALGVATTLGFGPRFLHSTGQLHKGGPDSGVYLQITAEPHKDLPIPGWDETFGLLIAAEALGDLQSLERRRRRVLRLHLADAGAGLPALEEMVAAALSGLLSA